MLTNTSALHARAAWLIAGITLVVGITLVGCDRAAAQENAPPTSADFMLRYARKYLELTQANLSYDKKRIARIRGSVSETRMEEREEDVRVARQLLEAAEKGGQEREFAVFVRLAAAGYRAAYNNWQRAKMVHEKSSTAFSADDLKRLRLRAELALLNFEQGKSLIKSDAAAQTRWKMNLLFDEVLRLNERVEELRRVAR
jgi:hypothetical protein